MSLRITRYLSDYNEADADDLMANDEFAFARKHENGNITLWKGKIDIKSDPGNLEETRFSGNVYQFYELETRSNEQVKRNDIEGMELLEKDVDEFFPDEQYDLMLHQESPRRTSGRNTHSRYSWQRDSQVA